MSKKFVTVMIAIWSAIALALIGLLVYFMASGHSFIPSHWIYYNNGSVAKQAQYIDKSFGASGINEINVNAASADVSFSKSQDDDIKVNITGNGFDSTDGAQMYTVAQNDGTLSITQDKKLWRHPFFNFGSYAQRISITLPESYKKDLTLNLASGDITFSGDYTLGKVGIFKTSGDMTADSLTADTLTLKTVSGDVHVSKLDAHYEINSTSGDMRFDDLAGYGSISGISGNIECNISKLSGSLDVSATSGNIRIGLADGVNADISAHTTSGDINSDFDMSYLGRSRAEAKIGSSPYNTVNVSLLNGNVTFNKG